MDFDEVEKQIEEKARTQERKSIIIKMIEQCYLDNQIMDACNTSDEEIKECRKEYLEHRELIQEWMTGRFQLRVRDMENEEKGRKISLAYHTIYKLRCLGHSDDKILAILQEKCQLSQKEAEEFLKIELKVVRADMEYHSPIVFQCRDEINLYKGETRMYKLINKLLKDKRFEELKEIEHNYKLCQELYIEYDVLKD